MLRFDRKQQNSVKQLSFNKKKKMKRKKKSSKDLRKGPCKEHGTNKILPTR